MSSESTEHPYTDDIAAIWLFLLAEGGRWLPKHIAARVETFNYHTGAIVWDMYQRGQLRRYPCRHGGKNYTYGVDGGCKVPKTVSVAQIMDALGIGKPVSTS